MGDARRPHPTGAAAMVAAPLLAVLMLAACQPLPDPQTPAPAAAQVQPKPPPRRPVSPPPVTAPSQDSTLLTAYYARVERGLLAQGLLRQDGGGRDTPFDADTLARNFIRVALYDEYPSDGSRLVARQTASRLHRWAEPVRIDVTFGPTLPASAVRRDATAMRGYAARLARASGHDIRLVEGGGNFNVYVVTEDERRALVPQLARQIPDLSALALQTIRDLPTNEYCLVLALDPQDDGTYDRAIAIVRAEHPDLLRLACLHEEVAQGLGLSNDSPDARPSIFNDDEEFALLTRQDELLLRMLYDPRLRPGMSIEEATPIALQIARELLPGDV